LPTGLLAVETLSPGQHEVIVKIEPVDRYEPTFIVRDGIVDESLLRGKALTKSPPTGNLTLGLATMAKVYEPPAASDTRIDDPPLVATASLLSSELNSASSCLMPLKTAPTGVRGG
jgi:hypothetical protein